MNQRGGIILAGVKTTKLLLEIKKHLDWLNQFRVVHIPLEYFEETIGSFSVEIFKLGIEAGEKKKEFREGIILAGEKTVKLLFEIKKHLDWLNQSGVIHIPMEYFEKLIGDFSVEIFTLGVEVGKSEEGGK
ncbi:hypothetical protein V7654_20305 [Bacillus sp. JJ1609]|uniref:hypothetical protein n=1 Tax=Bacillus sp. JJ1609 TaxID=3122977 RepID=UPI0030006FC9